MSDDPKHGPEVEAEETRTDQGTWFVRVVGPVIWPSFLVSALATWVFFLAIDPSDLHAATFPGWEIGRQTGYSIGFLMFWAVSAGASFLTAVLVRRPEQGKSEGGK
ncbi:hypothetical protein ACN2MM_10135 [Alkalilimnicola ehrlichii MLHE-1]|uniref:Transmembrane protein n=1 Tax=Alkalilimnicola ehrlichii (strain ATCC BAA-1101 / DSM 17681 / MLHE-1) TaxID=187272 RepID=Q0A7G5_ALKEH|nr:hypothetical protein [Alkalilimnicola ehrlichii]ABI57222.1 hypothetical protein Mlg_1878 [Alkalilimnicola ehrlichii MLHE-1]